MGSQDQDAHFLTPYPCTAIQQVTQNSVGALAYQASLPQADVESFFEDVIGCLWDIMSREELLLLLTEVLKRIETKAALSREDSDALHQYLSELKTDLAVEHQVTLQKDQLDRKGFLNRFPRVKWELEELIGKLHALTDKVDKVHRDRTISNIVANSTGAVSGVLTILGLALAPMTAGASLALSATGLGLGAAAAVTSVSTSIVELQLALLEVLKISPQTVSTTKKFTEAVQRIEMNIRAMETVKSNPGLAADANVFISSRIISVQSSQQEEVTFKSTALAMTKGARIVGAATAGVCLLMDVAFLVKEAKHLYEGAKMESAERLRQLARELEKKLEVLTRIYESLQ
ncbi:apolipoprotein L2-like [Megaptera novaeangliae]